MKLFDRFAARVIRTTTRREPDYIVGQRENPYLLRWYVTPWSGWYREARWENLSLRQKILRTLPNIYIHIFMRSDDDRALHDHPWASMSVILRGCYIEHLQNGSSAVRSEGDVSVRGASAAHRVELFTDHQNKPLPCHTLFITGPKVREWGFHCAKGWVHWRAFFGLQDGPARGDERGPGCE